MGHRNWVWPPACRPRREKSTAKSGVGDADAIESGAATEERSDGCAGVGCAAGNRGTKLGKEFAPLFRRILALAKEFTHALRESCKLGWNHYNRGAVIFGADFCNHLHAAQF
jgi:hypothetical protein